MPVQGTEGERPPCADRWTSLYGSRFVGSVALLSDYLCRWLWGVFCEATPTLFESPKGWTVAVSSPAAFPPYEVALETEIPGDASPGSYDIVVGVADGVYDYTTFRITVSLGFPLGGIAPGTLVRTPLGYVPVEKLRVGDVLMSYDPIGNRPVYVQLVSADRVWESVLLSVNDGRLLVTPFNQPIYVQSGTFTGWIQNPRDLHVGDSIFNAAPDRWVPIQSLDYRYGRAKVYSLTTDWMGTFLANGLLVGS